MKGFYITFLLTLAMCENAPLLLVCMGIVIIPLLIREVLSEGRKTRK